VEDADRNAEGRPDSVLQAASKTFTAAQESILDRLVHGGYRIMLRGKPMRKVRRGSLSNPPGAAWTTPGVATSRLPHAEVINLDGITDRLRPD
jgi:hypothetical protein